MYDFELTQQEIIDLVDGFINENGMWNAFVDYLVERGYTPNELGFPEEN